ncbi:MAG: ferrochelatase [Bacteroidota bacterium]|nr:ferrochelatase [Odoribacter sp.]MDP3645027.1 ferrochelatase [Bacteroidota bacterium]
MEHKKAAVLLINVGTPDEPTVKAVRRYLSEFLNDRRVIDIPLVLQKILVNLIIVPFRAPKSTKLYQRLWTEKGSPLLYYSEKVQEELQKKLDTMADVFMAMRYGNPSIEKALSAIRKGNYDKLVILPMFPQYASSTSGTAIQAVMDQIRKWNTIPMLHAINQFYDHPAFLNAFTERIQSYQPEKFDHIVFTYHGLPNRHLDKNHPGESFQTCNCENSLPEFGKSCYKATCYQTTRELVSRLGLKSGQYSVSFQSRLSKNWMTPFTDKNLVARAKQGCKNILVVAPAFVADCLETTVEIGWEYKELFAKNGGENLQMVESLNDSPQWISALKEVIEPCLFS